MEIWKTVDFAPDYMVSSLGRVYSSKNGGRILRGSPDKDGYLSVTLMSDGKKFYKKIHRLVASLFVDNPDRLDIVNHKNEDKQDNRASNLEWCTNAYNVTYGNAKGKHLDSMIRHGRAYCVQQMKGDKVVATFKSSNQAGKTTGISGSAIRAVCRKAIKVKNGHSYRCLSAGGYGWRYAATIPLSAD